MATGEELREVMRGYPAGVAVVTVDLGGERLGLTVGSLVSLSLEPPLVGIAISRQAALHELLREAGLFGLSLLSSAQESVARHFARGVPPIAIWQGIDVRPAPAEPPLLEGATGWLVCRVADELDAGDHTLFTGTVLTAERGSGRGALVYLEGVYVAV